MTTSDTPPPPQPAAGWYPDPEGKPGWRFFDGTNWTVSAPAAPPSSFPPPAAAIPPAAPTVKPGGSVDKRWAWGIVGAVLVVVVIASVFSDSGSDSKKAASSSSSSTRTYATSAPRTSTPPAPKTTAMAPAGSAVRDGKFEFQVLGVERGATSIDDAFGPEIAKGEFFTVKIRVTNIGDDSRSFSATNQKLIIDGNEYEATSFMDNGWMEDINPGLGIDTQATFDIPKGAVPTAIEFHDSMFSGGVVVALPPAN